MYIFFFFWEKKLIYTKNKKIKGMSILKYENFLTEKQIFQMINESILVFSPKLINILKKMSRNRIAQELLRLQKTDVEGIAQNYIDVTDRENLSFTPDRRVQQLMAGRPVVWKCIASNKCLGVIRLTLRSLHALPANSRTSAHKYSMIADV
jgi:hypothetical protein